MNEELYKLHDITLPPSYEPNPDQPRSLRDIKVHNYTRALYEEYGIKSHLDVGAWDGWLSLKMQKEYPDNIYTNVEWVYALCHSTERYVRRKNIKNFTVINGDISDMKTMQGIPKHDLVTAYEILEHIPYEEIPKILSNLEGFSSSVVSVILPAQDHRENPQHQWTPNSKTISELFSKKNPRIHRYAYPPCSRLPGNFLISWKV